MGHVTGDLKRIIHSIGVIYTSRFTRLMLVFVAHPQTLNVGHLISQRTHQPIKEAVVYTTCSYNS